MRVGDDLFTQEDRELVKQAYLRGYHRGYDSNYDTESEALAADDTDIQIDNLLFEHYIEVYVPNSKGFR